MEHNDIYVEFVNPEETKLMQCADMKALIGDLEENGAPEGFLLRELQPVVLLTLNTIGLINSEFKIIAMNGDQAEQCYTCPTCKFRGFMADMEYVDAGYGAKECCKKFASSL